MLAGGGPEEEVLRERLGEHATFLGWLEGDELARAYASADVFLFASRTDTFGQVILEAQASGLPVVAVAEGGPLSLIEDGRSGRLCPPDADALADALVELAGSPVLRERARRGRAGRRPRAQLGAGARAARRRLPARAGTRRPASRTRSSPRDAHTPHRRRRDVLRGAERRHPHLPPGEGGLRPGDRHLRAPRDRAGSGRAAWGQSDGWHELRALRVAASNGYRIPLGVGALKSTLREIRPDFVLLHDAFWGPHGVCELAHELGARAIAVHHASTELNAAGLPGPLRSTRRPSAPGSGGRTGRLTR